MSTAASFQIGGLVEARGREWVVLPGTGEQTLRLRPLGGAEEDAVLLYLPLEPIKPRPATFPLPDPATATGRATGLLLRDAMRLKLATGAGPFRSFGNLGVEPRAYQIVPLLMALRQETVRLLVADDVGIGKTIEGALIARELLDRGEIQRFSVICPPHLCEQWHSELRSKFHIETEIVRSGTAARLERGLPQGETIFDHIPFYHRLARLHQAAPAPRRVRPRLPRIRHRRGGARLRARQGPRPPAALRAGPPPGERPRTAATDCLSAGINLQQHFTAVVHYDLVWNPMRHEQREGRVDRFGQAAPVVRTLMLYGANNPVDSAVLRVILKKAERIRKEIGVAVPLPGDTNQVMQAVMQAVLLSGRDTRQYRLDLPEIETQDRNVETLWQSARDRARASRTIFAQHRLRPEDVLPEWHKATAVLSGPDDVERFARAATDALGAPLHDEPRGARLPVEHLPAAVRERFSDIGIERAVHLTFDRPGPSGIVHAHRGHPVVRALAELVAEAALSDEGEIAARCGALFTDAVSTRTALLILRLRSQIETQRTDGDAPKRLLAEECVVASLAGDQPIELLDDAKSRRLLAVPAARDMAPEQRRRMVDAVTRRIEAREADLTAITRAGMRSSRPSTAATSSAC